MGPGTEKARRGLAVDQGHGILGLVAVAGLPGAGDDGHQLQALAADAVQRVGDPPGLGIELLFIVHVPEDAAAAGPRLGAARGDPVGAGLQHLENPPVGGGVA